jgi:hypothetical protein
MYDLIPQIVFFASLAVIVYLFVRAAPRVSHADMVIEEKKDQIAHLISRIPLDKIDAWLNATLEKGLRKAKVGVLKLDNTITRFLHNVRAPHHKNGQGKEKIDLFVTMESVEVTTVQNPDANTEQK